MHIWNRRRFESKRGELCYFSLLKVVQTSKDRMKIKRKRQKLQEIDTSYKNCIAIQITTPVFTHVPDIESKFIDKKGSFCWGTSYPRINYPGISYPTLNAG